MRKSILLAAAFFSFAVIFTSCKEAKKEEVKKESHEGHDHDQDAKMAHDAYQCPMDCEKGKTYEKEGSCPVCKMDLKAQKAGMEHAEGCTCKEGGECKCAPGECKCVAETAKKECPKCKEGECKCDVEMAEKQKDCKMCEPGACSCKA